MFSIGDCSRITRLSIKALRLYHECGLLIPDGVDERTGYRSYSEANLARARMIAQLRELEFSLSDIEEILRDQDSPEAVLAHIERQRDHLKEKRDHYTRLVAQIQFIIRMEEMHRMDAKDAQTQIVEKTIEPMTIASLRYKGKYSECGPIFGMLGRNVGRWIAGKAFNLSYDDGYKEDGADVECCYPVKDTCNAKNIAVRPLPGGRFVTLIHHGPYEELGRTYEVLVRHIKEHEIAITTPSREVYIKAPGMFFTGNPKKYITEVQFLIDEG